MASPRTRNKSAPPLWRWALCQCKGMVYTRCHASTQQVDGEKQMATSPVPEELLRVRAQIDRIDHGLVLLLANRFALTHRVGELKAEFGLEALDPDRDS